MRIKKTQKKTVFLFLLSTFYFLLSTPVPSALAQTEQERIEQLREQIEQLEAQAKLFKNNIAAEKAKGASLKSEIASLRNQISSLEIQLSSTIKKIDKTKIEVTVLESSIFDTQSRINKQKGSMGRLMLFLNRQDSQDLLATLLKTQSISEFYRQSQYVEDINKNLIDLVDDLKQTQDLLEEDKRALQQKQGELQQLQQQQTAKKGALTEVRYERTDLLNKTKGQEAAYQKRLAEIQRQEAEFYTELRKLENAVVEGGLYIVHVTATNIPPKGTNIFQWPEEGYRITQGYGMTSYARRGAYGGAPHNGIDMASGYGSDIRAIGAGEVIAFGTNSGFGNWIAIKHDGTGLVSVYTHLGSYAGLRVGARVNTGNIIGYEGSTGKSTGSHLHLSLYRDFFTYEKNGELYFNYFEGSLNPLDYLP